MRSTVHHLAAIAAGTLLAVQTIGGVALAAPSDPLAIATDALYQNRCTRDREELAAAEAEGRAPEDQEIANLQRWRNAFTIANRHGAPQHNLCIFGDQFSDGDINRSGR
jgi:hypothetical protein